MCLRSERDLKTACLSAAAGAVLLACLAAVPARADEPVTVSEVQVTATRIPEPADRVPAYVSVIRGDDLRARHINDLRTALSLVAGVEAPSGGDAGPASAVPSLWGVHEFDAFLLVVDGVPWGGAFNPAISDLDMTNVERIEVLKGSAPVMYGATSFVGVIQVIHYPAGQASQQGEVGFGTYGSWRGAASVAFPDAGGFKQSIAVDGEREGYSDRREVVSDLRGLYRLSGPLAGGTLGLDADAQVQRTKPPSPVVRDGAALTTLTPLDANFNTSDGRIDENRYNAVLRYAHPTPLGTWETTASISHAHIDDIRGFLRADLSGDADTQNQDRNVIDDYFDTHIAHELGNGGSLVVGADLLYGRGTQASRNGEFSPGLSGVGPYPASTDLHVDEINLLNDRRLFAGQYAQLDLRPDPRLDINVGLRLNETWERKLSTHLDGFDSSADTFDDRSQRTVRGSGMAGLTWKAWTSGADETVLYFDYRSTFKPAAVDFGPDNTPDILAPETAQSWEAGVKGSAAGGRLDWQAGIFLMDFRNMVVATSAGFANAGSERLKGFEAEGRWTISPDLSLQGAFSWHDARFVHATILEDDVDTDVSGKHLSLSPPVLASIGLVYSPSQGLFGSVVASYVDQRWLDVANTARARAYTTLDGGVGYRWGRYSLAVNGYNLTNERQPVTASEFGDGSFYLTPARKLFLDLTARF
jgi:outer membrane receptor protein involved in Fe transport